MNQLLEDEKEMFENNAFQSNKLVKRFSKNQKKIRDDKEFL